uniref:Uncharacterized protein n=1 Tax=Vitrella brassicaformis TaxID=1169539 RepID=A0A7S1K2M0_9ALVE
MRCTPRLRPTRPDTSDDVRACVCVCVCPFSKHRGQRESLISVCTFLLDYIPLSAALSAEQPEQPGQSVSQSCVTRASRETASPQQKVARGLMWCWCGSDLKPGGRRRALSSPSHPPPYPSVCGAGCTLVHAHLPYQVVQCRL